MYVPLTGGTFPIHAFGIAIASFVFSIISPGILNTDLFVFFISVSDLLIALSGFINYYGAGARRDCEDALVGSAALVTPVYQARVSVTDHKKAKRTK